MTKEWFVENVNDEINYASAINETLFHTKYEFQDIKVVDTKAYGRMLIIDQFVMLTEEDEFVYHEMLAHIQRSTTRTQGKSQLLEEATVEQYVNY